MTPNDIVGMALLNGLDIIAITDHNSLQNAPAVINVAKEKNLVIIPGLEVSTAEEVHVLCLFPCLKTAQAFEDELIGVRSKVENRKDIFGNQLIYDENDRITDEVNELLVAPTEISFDALYTKINAHGGAFIPAHIDRDSFSVLSNLGFLPPDLDIKTLEVSQNGKTKGFLKKTDGKYAKNQIITSSDAHRLWEINERVNYIELPKLTAKEVINYLR
jgi:predicted metal-dependent phosphoesterase TrpH